MYPSSIQEGLDNAEPLYIILKFMFSGACACVLPIREGTLQAGPWVTVWIYSLCGSGITKYRASVSWPANRPVERFN
jgi:hypothetical protein